MRPTPPDPIRGTIIRTVGDPEQVAAELLERMGPAMAGAVASALLALLSEVAR